MPEKGTRGKRARSQDVTATADDKLHRHLRSLGLESAESYRAWCRQHGFSDSLRKSWQEERQERLAAQKSAAAVATTAEALRHVEALGLKTIDEYQGWCRQHGFPSTLNKSRAHRQQEVRLAERLRSEVALATRRRHTRRPQETLDAISRGEIGADELKSPVFALVHELFATLSRLEERTAFLQLLLHAEKLTDLLDVAPAMAVLGPATGNSYVEALCALATHVESWLRPLAEWRPDSRSRRRQFGSLVRHLLARYFVPGFMDAAWFAGTEPEARRQQEWFIHIGSGQNIRTADLPVRLTKMMAHRFMEAPADLTIAAALRWGQILGLEGDVTLARAVAATRLGEAFEQEEFWATVLQWFVNHPMLDTACVGPIIDYVHHQKFVPREIVTPDGVVEIGDPAQPEFSMKGRSAAALLARVEEWHAQLAREAHRPNNRWEKSGIGEFRQIQEDKQSGNVVCWTIQELLSSRELREEGRAMNHCVASYANSCVQGRVSIWSVRLEDCQQAVARRVMTIEVKGRTINQARGRANAFPGSKKDMGGRLKQAHHTMRQWAAAEQLRVASHL